MSMGRAAGSVLAMAVIAAAAYGGFLAYQGRLGATLAAAKSALADAAAKPEAAGGNRGRASANRTVTVEVAQARTGTSTTDIRAVGSLQSDESVVIATEVAGRISEIAFKEGRAVKKDDILVRLDNALAKAELADAKARYTLADANNDRAQTLSKTGAVTGRTRDEAVSNLETAQAAVALAETRLSKLDLRAPFDGVAGLRGVSVGAFVNVGTPIANLEKIDTLKVDFKIPEVHLADVKTGQKVEITVDALADKTFTGEIYAINPLVDVNGRALELRARLDNKDLTLRPGLFARILIKGTAEREVVFIPEAAVLPRGQDTFVYTVDGEKAVETRVKLGQRANAEVEVLEGLAPNATVVTAGQQKLRNGVSIDIAPKSARVRGEPALPSTEPYSAPAAATPKRRG